MISRGKRHRDVNPAFPSVNRYVAVSGSGSLSERAQASSPCKLRVWDVDLEAQTPVYWFLLYLTNTQVTLFPLSLFPFPLLKKVSQ